MNNKKINDALDALLKMTSEPSHNVDDALWELKSLHIELSKLAAFALDAEARVAAHVNRISEDPMYASFSHADLAFEIAESLRSLFPDA